MFLSDFKALNCQIGLAFLSSSHGLHLVKVIFSNLSPSLASLIRIFADNLDPSLSKEVKFFITAFFKSP